MKVGRILNEVVEGVEGDDNGEGVWEAAMGLGWVVRCSESFGERAVGLANCW